MAYSIIGIRVMGRWPALLRLGRTTSARGRLRNADPARERTMSEVAEAAILPPMCTPG
jgi:hypothetical protein